MTLAETVEGIGPMMELKINAQHETKHVGHATNLIILPPYVCQHPCQQHREAASPENRVSTP